MLVAKDLLSICCCPSDCSTGEAGLSQRHVESPAAAPRELCLEEPEEAVHDGVGVDAGNQDGLLGPHAQNGVGVAALCRCPEPDPHVDHGILCLVSQSVTIRVLPVFLERPVAWTLAVTKGFERDRHNACLLHAWKLKGKEKKVIWDLRFL